MTAERSNILYREKYVKTALKGEVKQIGIQSFLC